MNSNFADLAASQPAVIVRRAGQVESLHRATVAACDSAGVLHGSLGEPRAVVWLRSAAKPVQALPFVTVGSASRLAVSDGELAIACSSHGGERSHLRIVKPLLERIGLPDEALQCGAHPPLHQEAADAVLREGKAYSVLHNNCSGKHTAMLAACIEKGWDRKTYLEVDHPLQKAIRDYLAQLTDMTESDLVIGVDGCSAPNFVIPLEKIALLYARLGDAATDRAAPSAIDKTVWEGFGRLGRAMRRFPHYVGGTGMFDTELMEASPLVLVAKGGAEGVQAVAVTAPQFEKPLGIAIKIEDGSKRALPLITIAVLKQLGVISADDASSLMVKFNPERRNHAGLAVGDQEVVFELRRPEGTLCGG